MKIKLLLLAIITFTFYACTPEIKDNARSLVKGKVVDNDGNPIANISVRTEGGGFLLGKIAADEQGDFKFTSLESTDDEYRIIVNKLKKYPYFDEQDNKDEYFSDTLYTQISYIYKRSEYQKTYTFPHITLKKRATLNFSIEKTSTANDTLYWNLSLINPECKYLFDGNEENPVTSYCYARNDYSDRLRSEDPNYETKFKSVLNSEAIFTYHINQGEQESVNIELTQPNTNYVFEY